MCWEESNFLTCLAANQSYLLSYLAFLNIGISSLYFIVIWIKEHAQHACAKKLSCKIFDINEKNCFLIVRFRRSKLIIIKYFYEVTYFVYFSRFIFGIVYINFLSEEVGWRRTFFWKVDAFFPNFLFIHILICQLVYHHIVCFVHIWLVKWTRYFNLKHLLNIYLI